MVAEKRLAECPTRAPTPAPMTTPKAAPTPADLPLETWRRLPLSPALTAEPIPAPTPAPIPAPRATPARVDVVLFTRLMDLISDLEKEASTQVSLSSVTEVMWQSDLTLSVLT